MLKCCLATAPCPQHPLSDEVCSLPPPSRTFLPHPGRDLAAVVCGFPGRNSLRNHTHSATSAFLAQFVLSLRALRSFADHERKLPCLRIRWYSPETNSPGPQGAYSLHESSDKDEKGCGGSGQRDPAETWRKGSCVIKIQCFIATKNPRTSHRDWSTINRRQHEDHGLSVEVTSLSLLHMAQILQARARSHNHEQVHDEQVRTLK